MKFKLVLLAALLFAGNTAQAQIPSSSSEIRSNPAKDARARGAIELVRMVKCALQRRETLGRNILTSRPGSNEQERMISPFRKVMENCMNEIMPAMYLGNTELRGAIAEYFYLRAHPYSPNFGSLDHKATPLPTAWTSGKINKFEQVQVLGQDFASCVVAADPINVDAMIRTEIRSAEEKAAFKRLIPVLGPCLPNGLKLELDVAWLRAVTAEALWRSIPNWTPLNRPTAAVGN